MSSRRLNSRGRRAPVIPDFILPICAWRRRSGWRARSMRRGPLWLKRSSSDLNSTRRRGCAYCTWGRPQYWALRETTIDAASVAPVCPTSESWRWLAAERTAIGVRIRSPASRPGLDAVVEQALAAGVEDASCRLQRRSGTRPNRSGGLSQPGTAARPQRGARDVHEAERR